MKDGNRAWWRGNDNVERILVTYFTELFTSSLPENIVEVTSVVQGKIKEDHFRWCEEQFSVS